MLRCTIHQNTAQQNAVQCSAGHCNGAHISSCCGRPLVQQQLHDIQVPAVRCVHQGSFTILSVACGWMCSRRHIEWSASERHDMTYVHIVTER